MSVSPLVASMLVACFVAQPPAELRTPDTGRKLMIAGAVTLGLGVSSFAAAAGVRAARVRADNNLAEAASVGPTGFPAMRYADVAHLDRRAARLRTAAVGLAIAGGVLVLGGAVLLVVGDARHARRHRVAFDASGVVVRW